MLKNGVYVKHACALSPRKLGQVLSNPHVDGVATDFPLSVLRAGPDVWDFRALDEVFATAQVVGKGVLLRILGTLYVAGDSEHSTMPQWVRQSMQCVEAIDTSEGPTQGKVCAQPVPWTDEFRQIYGETIYELLHRYGPHPALSAAATVFAGMGGEQQMLAGKEHPELWLDVGYRENIVPAWGWLIDQWSPRNATWGALLGIGQPIRGGEPDMLDVIGRLGAKSSRGIGIHSWHAGTNPSYAHFVDVMRYPYLRYLQALCPWNSPRNDGTGAQAWKLVTDAAGGDRRRLPHIVEVYVGDLDTDPATVQAIHEAVKA